MFVLPPIITSFVDDEHRPVTAAATPTAPIKCPGLEIDCACHGKSAATAARICHTRRRSAVICLESTQADRHRQKNRGQDQDAHGAVAPAPRIHFDYSLPTDNLQGV